jgi:hypothetical protein
MPNKIWFLLIRHWSPMSRALKVNATVTTNPQTISAYIFCIPPRHTQHIHAFTISYWRSECRGWQIPCKDSGDCDYALAIFTCLRAQSFVKSTLSTRQSWKSLLPPSTMVPWPKARHMHHDADFLQWVHVRKDLSAPHWINSSVKLPDSPNSQKGPSSVHTNKHSWLVNKWLTCRNCT